MNEYMMKYIRQRLTDWARSAVVWAMVWVVSIFGLLIVELLNRRSYDSFLIWTMVHHQWLWTTVLLIFLWNAFWICLRNRASAGVRWGNGLLVFLSLVNYYKVEFRQEPFELTDLTQAREGVGILSKLDLKFPPLVLISLAAALILLPLFLPRKKRAHGLARWLRVLVLAAVLAAYGAFYFQMPVVGTFEMQELYRNSGYLRGLAETLPKDDFKAPEGYSPGMVLAAMDAYASAGEDAPAPADGRTPDIVFVMSESLYDLEGLGQLSLSQDPLQGFKDLQERYASGQMMGLGYGGGTYYSEYEVLTGYRVADTPGKLYYDPHIMHEGMATALTVLENHGYRTMAIHPNNGGFYKRTYNYGCIGFDTMLFSDNGITGLKRWGGGYPTDRSLFEFAERQYDQWEGDGPRFMHIVTYQNHGGYQYDPVRTDVKVANREGLEKTCAENFANGVLEHVEALQELLDWFAAQERDVVVVVWGDHAPNMGQFGITMPESASARVPYYLTPLLIWNNYGADFTLPDDGVMPPYRLGAWLLSRLGYRDDAYLNLVADARQPDMMTVLHLLEKDGGFYMDLDAYGGLDDTLRLLHYDRLLGGQYGEAWRSGQ